jgi:hypothetical protein
LLVAVLVAVAAHPSPAAKWHGCPEPVTRTIPSLRGAVTAPFAHPGHDLGIVLSEAEVAESGGFATTAAGNEIAVTFASLFGAPVALAPFPAAAVSPATLYFTFPDTQSLFGRPLAGPVEIQVTTGGRPTAHVRARDLVGLPPATDVARLVTERVERQALATLDARGAVWIPVQFAGMGSDEPRPQCPAAFIPLTAFAVGVGVRANLPPDGAGTPTYPPFRKIRRADVYLGDFDIYGTNLYGTRLRSALPLLRVPHGFAVAVCALNDAVDLVLRARGRRRWAAPDSGFAAWMPSSQPLTIALTDVSADPGVDLGLQSLRVDAFGTECVIR